VRLVREAPKVLAQSHRRGLTAPPRCLCRHFTTDASSHASHPLERLRQREEFYHCDAYRKASTPSLSVAGRISGSVPIDGGGRIRGNVWKES
jgi:hypothetical protein